MRINENQCESKRIIETNENQKVNMEIKELNRGPMRIYVNI